MYRVIKALNHNAVLALKGSSAQEYLILGKGIGFGKKVSERIQPSADCTVYSLQSVSERGKAKELLRDLDPQYLEIADKILREAEKMFGKLDWNVLFPMADHIAFAAKRIQKGEQISNPLTQDIQVLFYKEYKAASQARDLLMEYQGITLDEDEIGYIALHVHSAICDEKLSEAMQIAAAVRECISMIEKDMGKKIDVQTLSYNRLMNHIKYMAARALGGEELKLNMNQYIRQEYPVTFEIAATVCRDLGRHLKKQLPEIEIGYLAMHIERVYAEDAK
ncbi:MAG TPA: PRD domain-containing protein [Candidatus Choladousia intestinigallinarum]|nr:PRD domain-containing protein [Candidatus Choladousia intestinigallinarum]